ARPRSVMRNPIPALTALGRAARMLLLMATVGAMGSMEKTRPLMTKNGLPARCGRPTVEAAAMYSLASRVAAGGAREATESGATASAVSAAARYDGRCSVSEMGAVMVALSCARNR